MIRSSKTWQAVALTAVAGLALSACGTTDTGGGGGDAAASDCNFKIGVMGALSGANASIVLPSVDGAKLALSAVGERGLRGRARREVRHRGRPGQGDPGRDPDRRRRDLHRCHRWRVLG